MDEDDCNDDDLLMLTILTLSRSVFRLSPLVPRSLFLSLFASLPVSSLSRIRDAIDCCLRWIDFFISFHSVSAQVSLSS